MREEEEALENVWHLRWHLRSLALGLERAELVGGGQWAEPRALRSAGVGSLDVAGRSLAPFEQ